MYIKIFFGGPTCNEYLSLCKISSSVVLRFWQYSSSTRLSGRSSIKIIEDKELEKTCFAVFPGCYVTFIFDELILFCMF